jgi:hypothetical protein
MYPDEATVRAVEFADTFVTSARARKDAQAAYDTAKTGLLEWLGDELVRNLPDGRVVSRNDVTFAEATISRKAYVSTTLTVGPPPALSVVS